LLLYNKGEDLTVIKSNHQSSPMVDTFTLHSLVRYSYQECSLEERILLEEIAEVDKCLKEEMNFLKKAKSFLPDVLFYPKSGTIDRIKDYSQRAR